MNKKLSELMVEEASVPGEIRGDYHALRSAERVHSNAKP